MEVATENSQQIRLRVEIKDISNKVTLSKFKLIKCFDVKVFSLIKIPKSKMKIEKTERRKGA